MGFRYIDEHVLEYFSYTAVPDAFFDYDKHPEFRTMSLEAKVLYSKMYRRAMMSRQRGKIDDQGHVYIIYSVKEACKELCFATEKATKIFKELNALGLIVKQRTGAGNPVRTYVMDFSQYESSQPQPSSQQPQENNTQASANQSNPSSVDTPDASNFENRKFENRNFENRNQVNNTSLGVNNTSSGVNNTRDIYNTGDHYSQSVSQSERLDTDGQTDRRSSPKTTAKEEERSTTVQLIRKNIAYDFVEQKLFSAHDPDDPMFRLLGINRTDWELFDSIFQIMSDFVMSGSAIRIGQAYIPYKQMVERLLQIREQHMSFVISKYATESQNQPIRNPRKYLLTCIYNSPADMVAGSYT